MALLLAACGGDDDSKNGDASVVGDANSQSDAGGVGRGRGGGGLGEGDGGDETDDAKALADAGQTVDAAKADAMVKVDAPTACASACDEINSRYQTAVKAAQGCVTTNKNQCALSEPSSLICGVEIPVNTNTKLKSIQAEWAAASCNLCPRKPCLDQIAPVGTVVCQKNATTTAAQNVGADVAIINPDIVIVPITPNDGTCKRIFRLVPL